MIKRAVAEALNEQTRTGENIHVQPELGDNSTQEETQVANDVELDTFELYQKESFWIFHIGPEIFFTLLSCLLFVSLLYIYLAQYILYD